MSVFTHRKMCDKFPEKGRWEKLKIIDQVTHPVYEGVWVGGWGKGGG